MLTKILLLIVVIVFAWFGWRWIKRVHQIGREKLTGADKNAAANTGASASSASSPPPRKSAEDMEKCPECGAYVAPRLAGPCGRPGCPYG
jgi:hypothetical protein